MPIYINNNEVAPYGVESVYVGNQLVYENAPVGPDYLCITAEYENSEFEFKSNGSNPPTVNIYFSYNRINWYPYSLFDNIVLPHVGDKIYLKGNCPNGFGNSDGSYISLYLIQGLMGISGDITTMLNEVGNVLDLTSYGSYVFYNFFYLDRILTSAPKLPSLILTEYCYLYMFRNCESLVNAPELPATNLAKCCYFGMFYHCEELITPSLILPAITLQQSCYELMYAYCYNLLGLSRLPATYLATDCYKNMYLYCQSIKMSETQIGEYINEFTFGEIPDSNTASGMFSYTSGTFTSTPTQLTYYTSNSISPTTYATINTSIIGNGTVTGGGNYEVSSQCTLIATPDTHYEFKGWYINETCISLSSTYTFIVSNSYTYTALFESAQTCNIITEVTPVGSGTTTGDGTYFKNDYCTITATPNSEYNFVGWYNGSTLVSSNNPYTFTVNNDITYTATFEPKIHITTLVNPVGYGTVTGAGYYNVGNSCTLMETPSTGKVFTGWYLGSTYVTNASQYTFTVSTDAEYTAKFRDKYTMTVITTVEPEGSGTTTGDGTYTEGDTITLVATPASGYAFDGWYHISTKKSTSETYSFTASGSGQYTYKAKFYNPSAGSLITITSNGMPSSSNAYILDNEGNKYYKAGSSFQVPTESSFRIRTGSNINGTVILDGTTVQSKAKGINYVITPTNDINIAITFATIGGYTFTCTTVQ